MKGTVKNMRGIGKCMRACIGLACFLPPCSPLPYRPPLRRGTSFTFITPGPQWDFSLVSRIRVPGSICPNSVIAGVLYVLSYIQSPVYITQVLQSERCNLLGAMNFQPFSSQHFKMERSSDLVHFEGSCLFFKTHQTRYSKFLLFLPSSAVYFSMWQGQRIHINKNETSFREIGRGGKRKKKNAGFM